MKIQNLIYFVETAKYKSMTKAAMKLYISQAAISKGINELEKELDCQLFKRKKSQLILTEEGERCFTYSEKILMLVDSMPDFIKKKENKPLKVGYIIVGYLEFLLNIINKNNQLKDVSIIPVYGSTNEIQNKLENNELDFAILPCIELAKNKNISIKIMDKQKLHILVYKSHPLFHYQAVSIEDIRKYKIVIWSEENHRSIYTSYHNVLIKNGVKEKAIIANANIMGDMIALMKTNHAIGLAGPITSSLSKEEYRTIPIVDLEEELYICLEWNTSNSNDAINNFIHVL